MAVTQFGSLAPAAHRVKVNTPYRVVIVVDRGFGQRLEAFSPGEAVWVIDSPINTPVAQRLWKSRAGETHLTEITTVVEPFEEIVSACRTLRPDGTNGPQRKETATR